MLLSGVRCYMLGLTKILVREVVSPDAIAR